MGDLESELTHQRDAWQGTTPLPPTTYERELLQADLRLLAGCPFFVGDAVTDDRLLGRRHALTVALPAEPGKFRTVDYFERSGQWRLRGGRAAGFGIVNLIRYFRIPNQGKGRF